MKAISRVFMGAWVLLTIFVSPALAHGGTAVQAWVQYYYGPMDLWDQPLAVAVDSGNNVIVTGVSTGGGKGPNYGTTIKFSGAGVPFWTNRYSQTATSSDYVTAMALDRSDNVIVTGYSFDTGVGLAYATMKYSSAGVPLWTNHFDGAGHWGDFATAVTPDTGNNVIVTGWSQDAAGDYGFATLKYVCFASPVISDPLMTNGIFQMKVDAILQPGTLVIEASTNLADWSPIFTNTTPTSVLFYTDPDSNKSPIRLYRANQFP